MFVQQIYKAYENISLKPKAISKELRLYLLEAHREPLYDKNQYLSTIRFEDFQQFCHDYCKQIQIKAIIQGNVNKDQALSVMHNVLNALNCGKIENVSLTRGTFTRITTLVPRSVLKLVFSFIYSQNQLKHEHQRYQLHRIICVLKRIIQKTITLWSPTFIKSARSIIAHKFYLIYF